MDKFNVRMRASRKQNHISGAEKIVHADDLHSVSAHLIERALKHENGRPDAINISVKLIDTPIQTLETLPIKTIDAEEVSTARKIAQKLLQDTGIGADMARDAIELLAKGAAPDNTVMRGAVILDSETGHRLEPDRYRGVRASTMDMTQEASADLREHLKAYGLADRFSSISEALVLATKVARMDGTIAELCWSDDPNNTVGYVASEQLGFVRITNLKPEGSNIGGRIFFVEQGIDLESYIDGLEKGPVLINKINKTNF